MSIKITIPNTSSDVLTFGSANTPTAAQIAGIDSGSSNGQLALYTTASGTSTERVRVDASGNVGIGTSSPATKLDVNGPIRVGSLDPLYFGGTTNYITGSNGSNYLTFTTNNTERMRIDSSGNLLVGRTGQISTGRLCVQKPNGNNNSIEALQGDAGGFNFYSNASSNGGTYYHASFTEAGTQRGSITSNGTSTSYVTSSDYRLKEDIQPMTGALAKVTLLKPCTYKWNADGSDGEGFIAHELAEVVPQCVTGEKDAVDADGNPVYQGIDTSFLVATLTAAIQELKAEVDALKGTK